MFGWIYDVLCYHVTERFYVYVYSHREREREKELISKIWTKKRRTCAKLAEWKFIPKNCLLQTMSENLFRFTANNMQKTNEVLEQQSSKLLKKKRTDAYRESCGVVCKKKNTALHLFAIENINFSFVFWLSYSLHALHSVAREEATICFYRFCGKFVENFPQTALSFVRSTAHESWPAIVMIEGCFASWSSFESFDFVCMLHV